jgi:N-acetyl-anhydromuramyl-L-alanine amidase AmpD
VSTGGIFENTKVPDRQYESLLTLTRSLMKEYGITVDNVNGHGYISGEHTRCPWKYFPMKKFKHDIA